MDRKEHLLTCLAEEAAEVGQRVSKALRFGLGEIQQGQPLNNEQRITDEIQDFIAVAEILYRKGIIGHFMPGESKVKAKGQKIEKYMKISREQGVLSNDRS